MGVSTALETPKEALAFWEYSREYCQNKLHHLLVLREPVEGLVLAEVLFPATDLHLKEH